LIIYLDSSAVVPILVEEPGTATCRRLWNDADRRITSRLTYVEVAAALAMAEQRDRISSAAHDQVWTGFAGIWPDLDIVEVTAELVTSAAGLVRPLALRGYDAVHCATAVAIDDPELVAAAGDGRLLDAWRAMGMAVVNTSQ
jgi:predicted nucleic acid-binding protein